MVNSQFWGEFGEIKQLKDCFKSERIVEHANITKIQFFGYNPWESQLLVYKLSCMDFWKVYITNTKPINIKYYLALRDFKNSTIILLKNQRSGKKYIKAKTHWLTRWMTMNYTKLLKELQ